MSKITRLQADNFKKLSVIDIHPGAGIVPIRGRNAQGKSSTLDAIMAALGGKNCMPSRPVRSGADEGAIRLELDDGAVILRRFTADGKGDSIEVTNAEGFRAPSPQKMLDGLYASVAFDPLAFTRLEPAKQLLRLRGLVTLDVDVDALEKAIATDYDKRRDLGRDLKTAESNLAQMPKHDDVPAEPVDEDALEKAVTGAAEANALIERRRASRERFAEAIENNKALAQRERDDIAALQARIPVHEKNLAEILAVIEGQEKQIAEAEELPELVDVTEAQAELRAAMTTNQRVAANRRYNAQALMVASLQGQVANLTTALDERKTAIADAIARADMPVPGLGFGDGEVLFNNLPLEQASSAEQLRVSTAIGMATSPKLRVMLVRDGSLLDDEGEKILAELAEANDFQLWVEAVDTSGKVGIVLEDGAVSSIDGEAPPEPEGIEKPKRRAKKDPDPKAAVSSKEISVEPSSSAILDPDPKSEEINDQDGPVLPAADRDLPDERTHSDVSAINDDPPFDVDPDPAPAAPAAAPAKVAAPSLFD